VCTENSTPLVHIGYELEGSVTKKMVDEIEKNNRVDSYGAHSALKGGSQ